MTDGPHPWPRSGGHRRRIGAERESVEPGAPGAGLVHHGVRAPEERDTCSPWLARELALLSRLRVIVVLGGFGWTALWPVLAPPGTSCPGPARVRPRCGGRAHRSAGPLTLLGSYHVASRTRSPADYRADARRRPRPGDRASLTLCWVPPGLGCPHGAATGDPDRRRRIRRALHRAAAAEEAVTRPGGDRRGRPAAAHDLPAVPPRGCRGLGRAPARRRAAAHDAAPLPGDHRRGHRRSATRRSGPGRSRSRARRSSVLRRAGDGRGLGGADAAHPRPGRTRHRLQERRRGDLPAQPRPRPARRRQLHRRPGGAAAGAHVRLRRWRLRRCRGLRRARGHGPVRDRALLPRLSPADMRWVLVEATGRILPEVDLDMAA